MSTLLDTPAGRLGNGRFGPGNAGGPGNPNARHTAQLRQALFNALTEEDMDVIVKALIDKAKEGNMQAIKMVLHYTIGKPTGIPLSCSVMDMAEAPPSPNGQNGEPTNGVAEPSPNGEIGGEKAGSTVTAPIANGKNGQSQSQPASIAAPGSRKLSRRARRKLREAVKRAGLGLGGR